MKTLEAIQNFRIELTGGWAIFAVLIIGLVAWLVLYTLLKEILDGKY